MSDRAGNPAPTTRDDKPRPTRSLLPSPVGAHVLDSLISDERAATFRQVLARRSTQIAVVLEDCYDPHNATAVMRTCDIFGLMRVHVTTSRQRFKINRRVSQGAHRYLDLRVHHGIDEAYAQLRADGYRILVSDLVADAVVGPQHLAEIVAAGPLALVFGNEHQGLSDAATAGADGAFLLPMAGMAQSLNLSVAVATTLYSLRGNALAANQPGNLSPADQLAWYERWIRRQRPEAADETMTRAGLEYAFSQDDPAAQLDVDRQGNQLEVFAVDQPPADA